MYTRCSTLVAGEKVGENREKEDEDEDEEAWRVLMGGERSPDGRRVQTHLEEKREKPTDGQRRQKDQKCIYEGGNKRGK